MASFGRRVLSCRQSLPIWGLVLLLAGCGSNSSTNNNTNTNVTGLAKRVLLTNRSSSAVIILDAIKDQFATSFTVTQAGRLVTNGGFTMAIQEGQPNVSVIDNTQEASTFSPPLPNPAVDVAVSPDGKFGFAAVRNSGELVFVNTADGTTSAVMNLPSIHRLVLSPKGTKMLAFPDDPSALPAPNTNGFYIIDIASRAVTVVTGAGLDQPFTALFNGSETKALILNCGAECGGTAASVQNVDFSGATPVLGTPIPVAAATVGVLNGTTLFVAGTPAGASSGTLQAVNLSSQTAGAPVTITDGTHTKMALASNNRLYVGATGCTPQSDASTGQVRGCLTIVNTTSGATVFPEFSPLRSNSFDVTGLQPISNRTVVYVCEGGELDIFDTTTDKLTANQLDVVGFAVDVVQIDP